MLTIPLISTFLIASSYMYVCMEVRGRRVITKRVTFVRFGFVYFGSSLLVCRPRLGKQPCKKMSTQLDLK